ncbi:hypothetical protein Ddye_000083 [Dipteronia dyeriana]|uniref:Protein kinase domain-containing protein n=1 Tax=Dipteronia dyeriana TaxID=168575 RepID=A0AAE0CS91_9ROSI|nr:hypothetical protein Ddye_000083 [Dipteronia dyeriana]
MGCLYWFLLVFVSWVLLIPSTHELQTSQVQVLLQLRKHLEYPSSLEILENYEGDPCNLTSTAHMSITCQGNSVTELKIVGDKPVKVNDFNGHAIPNQTLSESFYIDSFVTTLSRLTSLRVLSLVSLGIWGPLPDKIHRLSSLEVLDFCSNFMSGSIPFGISRLNKLQSLAMDTNFFNGSVPDWWDSLSNLTILSLKDNQLKGPFPTSICRITSLTDLAMSHNELSGKLPDMSTLTSLHVLDLRENKLDSGLPVLPKGLITILLSKNSFSGEIPNQFGELDVLQHLDLSFNHLSGTPPSALFSLSNISYLHLASNRLSGSLPDNLSCGSKLGFVDISNNKLTGVLPPCLDSTSDKTVVKFGGNCLSTDGQHQHQESYCREASMSKQSRVRDIGVLVAIIGGAVLFIVLLGSVLLILCRRYCSRVQIERHTRPKVVHDNPPTGVSSEVLTNARLISQAVKLGTQSSPVYRWFSLEELKEATNNFDSSSFMGEGSKGKLYKGRLENGTYVAIRSLTLLKKYSIQNLKVQLDFLSKLHHPHLVTVLGHCIDGGGQDDSSANKIFLVYEYVSNGNYRTHLSVLGKEVVGLCQVSGTLRCPFIFNKKRGGEGMKTA